MKIIRKDQASGGLNNLLLKSEVFAMIRAAECVTIFNGINSPGL